MLSVESQQNPVPDEPTPNEEAVRAELRRLLEADVFQRSQRLSRFLEYTVEQVLESDEPQLKEYAIALAVFDKPKTFDPRLDPIVRVEARRLRSRLREHYETESPDAWVRIRYPARGYRPIFESQANAALSQPEPGVIPIRKAPEREVSTGNRPREDAGIDGRIDLRRIPIAVLPFADLSDGENEDASLCLAITEELINALGRSPGVQVTSRTSTRRYAGKSFDIRKVGRALGVRALLEGSVRQEAERVRITVQLYSVADGLEIWSRTFQRSSRDVFSTSAELATIIADSLDGALAGDPQPPQGTATVPSDEVSDLAYHLYLRGLRYWRHDEGPSEAVANLERAVREQPQFASAHAALAMAHTVQAWFNEARPAEAWPKAESSAKRALELDPAQSTALVALACFQALFERNWNMAERTFLRAAERGASASAREWYACACLVPTCRLDEAAIEVERARNLVPLSPMAQCHAGLVAFYKGNAQAAKQLFGNALEIEDSFWPAIWNLGRVALSEGSLADAEDLLDQAQTLAQPGSLVVTGHLGHCYALRGKQAEALKLAAKLSERSRRHYVSPLHLARIYLGFGEIDKVFEQLERARQHRCTRLAEIMVDPLYAPLKRDARFGALTREFSLAAGA